MKTAISIPDPVFRHAERLAKQLKVTRSRLYSAAVADFVKRHRAVDVTDKLNAVYDGNDSALDEAIVAIQSRSLPRERW